jgi:hypothetical protein
MKWLSLLVTIGSAGCYSVQTTPVPMQNMAPPNLKLPTIVDFSATKTMVNAGDTVDLNYDVTDADTVTIATDTGAQVLPSSTELQGTAYPRALTDNTTFVLTAATKAGQAVTKSLSISVQQPMPMPMQMMTTHALIMTFSSAPQMVAMGQQATITWAITGASTAKITATGMPDFLIPSAQITSGTQQVTPMATTVYTLTAMGTDNQSVTMTLSVNVTTPTGMNLTAHQMFDQNVAPIMTARCASCHANAAVAGPDYLGTTGVTGYYAAITTYAPTGGGPGGFLTASPENSLLILKGEHTGPAFCSPAEAAGNGSGKNCSPTTELDTVTAWILKEASERGTMMMPPPTTSNQPRTVAEALTRFGACMDRTVWDGTYGQSNQTMVAYQNTTLGRCYACHSSGTAGSYLSAVSGDTFDNNRSSPDVLKLVSPTANPDGTYKDLIPANRWRDKGTDPGHPQFILTTSRLDALQGPNGFITQTLTRFHNYTDPCAAPPATPPATPPPGG